MKTIGEIPVTSIHPINKSTKLFLSSWLGLTCLIAAIPESRSALHNFIVRNINSLDGSYRGAMHPDHQEGEAEGNAPGFSHEQAIQWGLTEKK